MVHMVLSLGGPLQEQLLYRVSGVGHLMSMILLRVSRKLEHITMGKLTKDIHNSNTI